MPGCAQITFQKVALGARSTNDERFFFYYDYLARHPDIAAVVISGIPSVFRAQPDIVAKPLDMLPTPACLPACLPQTSVTWCSGAIRLSCCAWSGTASTPAATTATA
jgi:hypothetical protein